MIYYTYIHSVGKRATVHQTDQIHKLKSRKRQSIIHVLRFADERQRRKRNRQRRNYLVYPNMFSCDNPQWHNVNESVCNSFMSWLINIKMIEKSINMQCLNVGCLNCRHRNAQHHVVNGISPFVSKPTMFEFTWRWYMFERKSSQTFPVFSIVKVYTYTKRQ